MPVETASKGASTSEALQRLRAARAQFKSRLLNIQKLHERTAKTGVPGMGVVDGLTKKLFADADKFFVPAAQAYLESLGRLPASAVKGPAGKQVLTEYFNAASELQQVGAEVSFSSLGKIVENVCANALQVWKGNNGREEFVALLDAVSLGQMTGCENGSNYLKAQTEMERVLNRNPGLLAGKKG